MSLAGDLQQHRAVPLSPPGVVGRRQSEVRWVQGVECRVMSGSGFGGGSMRVRSTPPDMGKMGKLQKKGGALSESWLLVAKLLAV